jgi:crossover junction endodeoxyribonuclease RuvC
VPEPCILGIDPGSRVAGYSVLRVGPPVGYVDCGVLRLPKEKHLNERLRLLGVDLAELIDEFAPVAVALERAYLGEHAQALLVLSEVRGLIKGFALARGLEVLEFAPATVKRAATGRGRATKPEVRTSMMRLLGLRSPPPLDASDSLGVGYCGALHVARSLATGQQFVGGLSE